MKFASMITLAFGALLCNLVSAAQEDHKWQFNLGDIVQIKKDDVNIFDEDMKHEKLKGVYAKVFDIPTSKNEDGHYYTTLKEIEIEDPEYEDPDCRFFYVRGNVGDSLKLFTISSTVETQPEEDSEPETEPETDVEEPLIFNKPEDTHIDASDLEAQGFVEEATVLVKKDYTRIVDSEQNEVKDLPPNLEGEIFQVGVYEGEQFVMFIANDGRELFAVGKEGISSLDVVVAPESLAQKQKKNHEKMAEAAAKYQAQKKKEEEPTLLDPTEEQKHKIVSRSRKAYGQPELTPDSIGTHNALMAAFMKEKELRNAKKSKK